MSRTHDATSTMFADECSSCLSSRGLFLQAKDQDTNLLRDVTGDRDQTLKDDGNGEHISLKYRDEFPIHLKRQDVNLLLSKEAEE